MWSSLVRDPVQSFLNGCTDSLCLLSTFLGLTRKKWQKSAKVTFLNGLYTCTYHDLDGEVIAECAHLFLVEENLIDVPVCMQSQCEVVCVCVCVCDGWRLFPTTRA